MAYPTVAPGAAAPLLFRPNSRGEPASPGSRVPAGSYHPLMVVLRSLQLKKLIGVGMLMFWLKRAFDMDPLMRGPITC